VTRCALENQYFLHERENVLNFRFDVHNVSRVTVRVICIMDAMGQFWTEARRAIHLGVLSQAEARVIARTGTRKAAYWARHLADLRAVVAQRQQGARHDR